AGRSVSFLGMTISNGRATAGSGGGVVANNNSIVSATDCVFTGNLGQFGGGMAAFPGSTCILTDCAFSGNATSSNDGGAYDNFGANTIFNNCTFTDNTSRFAGAIFNSSGQITINDSTFVNNTAAAGGGALENFRTNSLIAPTSIAVNRCTFTNNYSLG